MAKPGSEMDMKISLSAPFWSPPTPEENTWLFSSQMLHHVHQLAARCVYLQFGAGPVVYSRFIRAFFCTKQLLRSAALKQ